MSATNSDHFERQVTQERATLPPPEHPRVFGKASFANNFLPNSVIRAQAQPRTDGGGMAWMQVIGAFLVIFNTQGYFNAFGIYQTYYTTELQNVATWTVSWIGSVQVWFVLFFLEAFSGKAVDASHFRPGFHIQSYGFDIPAELPTKVARLAMKHWRQRRNHTNLSRPPSKA